MISAPISTAGETVLPRSHSRWQHRNGEQREVIYTKPGAAGPIVVYAVADGDWWWSNWPDWITWVANAKEINDAQRGEPRL